ncbi:PIN domain-containing protein [Wenzhouxiangella sp. AB-CW3]|uniref:PIN domain-containing protein n=1 Tax=Wenzhouxiangella sp. AB-CW3 TaxID=2771012 RepID=UPI00168AECE0|nr:PIN domain-containing protein [Wenzhouxiangella sp. AB-CW3]QOC23806.1 PIN domain-containing protein [Wenzhouxiangella sp. AB-CW3]
MTETYFVDTNVLVYARDTTEPEKHSQARTWLKHLWANRAGRISTQVLKEYYQVVTHRLDPGLPQDQARSDIRDLLTWRPLDINAQTLEQAWFIEDRYKTSWWDALIIASAQQAGCNWLLSEDLQPGQQIENLTILNPLTTTINEATSP